MKRTTIFVYLAFLVVMAAGLLYYAVARAQEPCDDRPGQCLDARDATLEERANSATADIERLTAETARLAAETAGHDTMLADQADVQRAIGQDVIEIKKAVSDLLARFTAHEAGAIPPPGPGPAPLPQPDPVPAPIPSAIFPNTADGKPVMQLGLNGIAYWIYEDQFTNLLRQNGFEWAAGRRWPDGTTMNAEALFAAGLIDKATLAPTAIPATYTHVRTGLFRAGARFWPQHYAGTYVFDWEGDGDAICGLGNAAMVRVSPSRIECTYTGTNTEQANIQITRIGAGFKNPRLYRKENEAAINAGAIFDPAWLARLKRYKIIRTMDLQNTNGSWARSIDNRLTDATIPWGVGDSYSAFRETNGIQGGITLKSLFDVANASDTALWLHVSGLIGAPAAFVDPAGIANLANWQTGQAWMRATAKANATAIISSPEWRRYTDEIVRSMTASGYPTSRTLYVELWNEVWNTTPLWKMTYYNSGLAEGIGGVNGLPYRYGYGYMVALVAHQMDASLKASGREHQVWVSVLAGQNANPATTADALKGFHRYFKDKGIDPAPYLKRLGISTASYFYDGEAFDLKKGIFPAATVEERDAQWLAAITADREGLGKRLTDRMIGGPTSTYFGTVSWAVAMRAQHQKLAEAAGVFFLGDYEGGDHAVFPPTLTANPQFASFYQEWRAGPEGERLLTTWAEELRKQNSEAVIADYLSVGQTLAGQPWIEAGPGETNGRTRAINPYLRSE